MKKSAIILFVICSITSLYPQQFHSLDGIESSSGQTLLLYRLGSEEFYQFNPIFKYNTSTDFEMKIIDAYAIEYPTSADVKAVSDYEFLQNDTINFLNTGFRVIMDLQGYSAINDSFRFFYSAPFELVEISRQDQQKVFVSDLYTTFRSFDGGNTFPPDSILVNGNFSFLSLSDFNDNIWFGLNQEGELVKTNVGIVDTSKIIYDRYLDFYYDINQFHIYRVNKIDGGYSLSVSNNKGDVFTWTKTYQSENRIYVTIDSTQSGVVYLADGRKIYKSVNNGYTFSEYKSLPSKLVGIYKKPNSDILYAATSRIIYKITPDSAVVIKSIPVSPELFDYYPLAIGNYWIYKVTDWSYPYYDEDTFTRKVISKEILSNGKEYFKIEEKYYSSGYTNYLYERIDSAKGIIFRFDNECENPDSEKVIDNFNAEVGDSILIRRFTVCWDSILTKFSEFGSESIFNENRNFRTYEYSWLTSYTHKLAQGIGIYNIRNGYDFGESYFFLNGCVINDVVYGDTTLTDVDDQQNPFPTEYKLEQNYPNPFNPGTKISWQAPVSSWQTIKLYNSLGQEVDTIVDEYLQAGFHSKLYIVNSTLPSGIYFYQLKAGDFVQTKKMILLK